MSERTLREIVGEPGPIRGYVRADRTGLLHVIGMCPRHAPAYLAAGWRRSMLMGVLDMNAPDARRTCLVCNGAFPAEPLVLYGISPVSVFHASDKARRPR